MIKISFIAFIASLSFYGCASKIENSEAFFELKESTLQLRELQSKVYETSNDDDILRASISSLQDLGFEIGEVSYELGTLQAQKDRDAQATVQNVKAYFFATLSILAGDGMSAGRSLEDRDYTQKIRVSIVISPRGKSKRLLRIVFQRAIFSPGGGIRTLETLVNKEIYEAFFIGFSKAIFLEGHNI